MKNLFLGMSVLAVAGLWTGCSNDEAVEASGGKQAISFRVQGGTPDLRATETQLQNVDAFVVYGTDDVAAAAASLLFNGVTVAREIGTDKFIYAPIKFYNFGAVNAAFFAYSPVSENVSNLTNVDASDVLNTKTTFDYTVVSPNNTGMTTQVDLLVASAEVPDITVGSDVSLTFYHALSRIYVRATNQTAAPVIIESVKLLNVAQNGTATIPTPITNTSGVTNITWDITGSTFDDYQYQLSPGGVVVPALELAIFVTPMEQGMLIIPQTPVNTGAVDEFDTGDFALEVKYKLSNLEETVLFVLDPAAIEFKAHNQYAIAITFNAYAITFDISVEPFGDIIPVTPAN